MSSADTRSGLALQLLRASHELQNAIEHALQPLGLSLASYHVLFVLAQSTEPLTSTGLGTSLLVRVPDVTRLVDRLIDAGCVTRTREASDRRIVRIALTPEGIETLARATPVLDDVTHRAFAHLTPGERITLADLLRSLSA